MQPTNVENVWIVPAGSPPPNPAELLGSSAMERVVEQLKERADIVLFDTPPTLLVADSIVLSARMDGVLLVVAFGDTKKANIRRSVELLQRAGTSVLGTVLNRISSPGGGYYYYYGYGYGYGYGKYYIPGNVDTPGKAVETTPEPAAVESSGTETK
jgi:capsular exopolysaccharide synthesis family protein